MTDRSHDHSPGALASTAGAERRRDDPIRKLSRHFDAVCLEATSPLEIAAHLEDNGFNSYRVRQEYGLEGPFELAERLYALTPRRQRLRPVLAARRRPSWSRRLVLAAALAVTALLVLQLGSLPAALLVVASAWLLGGRRAIGLIGVEGSKGEQQRVLTLLLAGGIAALTATALTATALTATALTVTVLAAGAEPVAVLIALLWWNVAGNLWVERLSGRTRTSFVALSLLVVGAALLPNVSPLLALVFALLTSVIGFSGLLAWPNRSTLRWLGNHLRTLAFALASGLGQGLLLAVVLGRLGERWLLAALLIALAIAAAEELAGWMRHHLALGLWLQGSESEARLRVWTVIDRVAKGLIGGLTVMMVVLPLLLLPTGEVWTSTPDLADTALLAFGMGLGLLLVSLSARALPSLTFLAAGLGVALGLPFTPIALALPLVLYLGLLGFLRNPRRYAAAVL